MPLAEMADGKAQDGLYLIVSCDFQFFIKN